MNKGTLIILLRFFLGYVFFSSGMAKLLDGHFPGIIGPVWLEQELAKYNLGLYARFIAYSQVIIGLLVLTQRYATIGSIMMVPLIANTLVVTISLNWRGTPYILTFLLLINIILLIMDWPKLRHLLPEGQSVSRQERIRTSNPVLWISSFSLIILSPLFYHLEARITYLLIAASFIVLYFAGLGSKKQVMPPTQ